jgi:hypothetical protein
MDLWVGLNLTPREFDLALRTVEAGLVGGHDSALLVAFERLSVAGSNSLRLVAVEGAFLVGRGLSFLFGSESGIC